MKAELLFHALTAYTIIMSDMSQKKNQQFFSSATLQRYLHTHHDVQIKNTKEYRQVKKENLEG